MNWDKAVKQIEQALADGANVVVRYHKKYHPDEWRRNSVLCIHENNVLVKTFRRSVWIKEDTHIIEEVIKGR